MDTEDDPLDFGLGVGDPGRSRGGWPPPRFRRDTLSGDHCTRTRGRSPKTPPSELEAKERHGEVGDHEDHLLNVDRNPHLRPNVPRTEEHKSFPSRHLGAQAHCLVMYLYRALAVALSPLVLTRASRSGLVPRRTLQREQASAPSMVRRLRDDGRRHSVTPEAWLASPGRIRRCSCDGSHGRTLDPSSVEHSYTPDSPRCRARSLWPPRRQSRPPKGRTLLGLQPRRGLPDPVTWPASGGSQGQDSSGMIRSSRVLTRLSHGRPPATFYLHSPHARAIHSLRLYRRHFP